MIEAESDASAEQAVRSALEGDATSIGQLLDSYRPRLERMVRFRLDPRLRSRIDAADVVQEAFAQVLRGLHAFASKEHFGFFLWVRLETVKRLRSVHREQLGAQARDARRELPRALYASPGASSFAIADALLGREETPSRVVARRERAELLRRAIESMREIDREVLTLRSFEQLSNQEVARLLGLSEAAATLRYVRALRRLGQLLCALDIEPSGVL